jgi:hypothetical protein
MKSSKVKPRSCLPRRVVTLAALLFTGLAHAQPSQIDEVIGRLTRLELENDRLRTELAQVRQQLESMRTAAIPQNLDKPETAAPAPQIAGPAIKATTEERLEIAERRIDEQAQTKVEASQRLPVRLSGMLLANLYRNGPHSGTADVPPVAASIATRRSAGLTFRQSILGLEYIGTQTILGARVRGALFGDFFEGLTESTSGYSPLRIRVANVALDWTSTSLSFAVDKPLFSPRDPSSFSFFGIAPLTAAGNLWRWQPQLRVEKRFSLTTRDRLRAQGALLQTYEELSVELGYRYPIERRRPALQGRFEYSHSFDEQRRVEIASSVHTSTTHAAGASVPSRLLSIDWFLNPWSKLEFSGTFFGGRNIHHFGALRQGFVMHPDGSVLPVHSRGGWAQLAVPATPRLTFNVFGGIHDDRNRDLYDGIGSNRSQAANIQYRIAPNVILSLEAMQIRTNYLHTGLSKNNRYDLAVAYLF